MSIKSNDILKSLAVLENSLKDINSAREQVNEVVETSEDLAEVLKSYKDSFQSLSSNVKAVIEDSRKFNLDSIGKLSEQTQNFSNEITKLTEFDVSNTLNSIESEAIKYFQQNLRKPLDELDKQVKNIQEEVEKLSESNFKEIIDTLEKEINEVLSSISSKIASLDRASLGIAEKLNSLQDKIDNIEFSSDFRNTNELIKHVESELKAIIKRQEANFKSELSIIGKKYLEKSIKNNEATKNEILQKLESKNNLILERLKSAEESSKSRQNLFIILIGTGVIAYTVLNLVF